MKSVGETRSVNTRAPKEQTKKAHFLVNLSGKRTVLGQFSGKHEKCTEGAKPKELLGINSQVNHTE